MRKVTVKIHDGPTLVLVGSPADELIELLLDMGLANQNDLRTTDEITRGRPADYPKEKP